MRETEKNYLERQKIRNLRSSLKKQPTFRNANTGFLRLVAGRGRGSTGYLRSNISPFHYLSWKVKGRKNRFRSFPRVIQRTSQAWWKYRENLQQIRYASPLWGNSSELATAPRARMTRSSTGFAMCGVPQVISALLLMLPAEIESVSVASRKYTTFFVRWSRFWSTLLKISYIVR